jgi:hypothetical protein
MVWHLLAENSTTSRLRVLCGAEGLTEKTTKVGFMSTASLKWDIVCQDCAAHVTPEMLVVERENLPSKLAARPEKRNFRALLRPKRDKS